MGIVSAGIVILLAAQDPRDPFTAQRNAAAARSVLSSRFTVAVAGSRTFRVGERIHLVLTYDDVPNRRSAENPCAHSVVPILDRAAGTADRRRDYFRIGISVPGGVCGCVEGGVVQMPQLVTVVEYDANGIPVITSKQVPPPPPPPRPRPPAVLVPYELTEYIRFDVPGRYRFYISDRIGSGTSVVSNIIEIEITPRDRRWEARTLRRAVRVIDSSTDSRERSDAIRTIETLPSREAIGEMGRREFARGLFAARDRDAAIAAFTKYVDDPASEVSEITLRILAGLHATRSPQAVVPADVRYKTMLEAHSRRLHALARAGVLVDRLTAAFQADLSKESQPDGRRVEHLRVTHALASVPTEVEAALNRLSAAERESILTSRRAVFAEDARFAPMLERLARRGSDAALMVLTDVAPSRARPIVLRDLRTSHPRLPLAISGRLVDDTLPALDAVFLRQLESANGRAQFAAALERIERYGSAAIAASVRRAYRARQDAHHCSVAIPALAYFFRTDPAFAATEFDAVRRSPAVAGEDCDADWRVDLPWLIAERRYSAALEAAAGEVLLGDDAYAAVRAGEMLADYGSPAAKTLVWRGLASWQRRWSAEQVRALGAADPSTWESVLEERLVRALQFGKEWRLQAADYDALTAACRRWACRAAVKDAREQAAAWTTYPMISRHHEDFSNRRGIYTLRGVAIPLTELAAQLRFFPRGTAFSAYQGSLAVHELWDVDLLADHLRLARVVRRSGMVIRPR